LKAIFEKKWEICSYFFMSIALALTACYILCFFYASQFRTIINFNTVSGWLTLF